MRRLRLSGRALTSVLLALLLAAATSSRSDGTVGSELETGKVRLGHGSIGGFRWVVYAERERSGNARRPCLTVDSGGTRWSRSGITVCGSVKPVPALIGHSSGAGDDRRTVLAMAFPPRITGVRLWFEDRTSRRIRLRWFGQRQSNLTGLDGFRYATRAFAGPFCLRRYASYTALNHLVKSSPAMGCAE